MKITRVQQGEQEMLKKVYMILSKLSSGAQTLRVIRLSHRPWFNWMWALLECPMLTITIKGGSWVYRIWGSPPRPTTKW